MEEGTQKPKKKQAWGDQTRFSIKETVNVQPFNEMKNKKLITTNMISSSSSYAPQQLQFSRNVLSRKNNYQVSSSCDITDLRSSTSSFNPKSAPPTAKHKSIRRKRTKSFNAESGIPCNDRRVAISDNITSSESSLAFDAKAIIDSQTPDMWKELEAHILSINDDTGYYKPKLNDKSGSDIYRKLIEDERRRRKARRDGLKKAINMTRKFTRLRLLGQNTADPETDSDDEEPEKKHKSRGWVLLRRYLQEKRLENKLKQSTGGWNLISKAVHHMTDVQKSRQNLYERYLHNPNSWREGLKNYEQYKHLFDNKNWKTRQKEMLLQQQRGISPTRPVMQRYNTAPSLNLLPKERNVSVHTSRNIHKNLRPNTAYVN